jgi:DNA repair exonuclease SbcCD ATPase subunit
MGTEARVHAVDALDDFRVAWLAFRADAQEALDSLRQETRRAFDWLADRRAWWLHQARECQEAVVQARSVLVRKQTVFASDRVPDCTEEIKALRKAQARLEHAEEKAEACRAWQTKLARAVEEFDGPTHQLGGILDGEFPRAAALLERLRAALDAYLSLTAGPSRAESVARAGNDAPARSEGG